MILTNNGGGSYTVNETTLNKTTYNLTTAVFVNGAVVATVLPYTFSPAVGVHDIQVVMTNLSATYTSKYCLLNDDSLYCQIITKLGTMKDHERAMSNLPYLYFILTKGESGSGCTCACDNVKMIYTELKQLLDDTVC